MSQPTPRPAAAPAAEAAEHLPCASQALVDLPNIGPALAARLLGAGITSPAELAALGPVAATLAIHAPEDPACYNTLYALAGALAGVRWHDLPRTTRTQMHDELQARL